jgi:transcriptional regulator with XRE-family HTH domain
MGDMKLGLTSPGRPLSGRPPAAVAIHAARLAAGLTQAQLARLSGVDQTTIAKLETGVWPLTRARQTRLLAAIASIAAPWSTEREGI